MASTRIRNDPSRQYENAIQSTHQGRYVLNTPGPGMDIPYIADPHIRLQMFGGNLHTNRIDLDSRLKGLDGVLSKGNCNQKRLDLPKSKRIKCSENNQTMTEHSRFTEPSWEINETTKARRATYVWTDGQDHYQIPFAANQQSRQEALNTYDGGFYR